LTLGLALPLGLALLPSSSCNVNTTNGNGTGGNKDLSTPNSGEDMSTGGGSGEDMSTGGGTNSDAGTIPYVPDGGCVGRQCQINYSCPVNKGPTTFTGVVNIPAGNLPVNNAIVYIPSGAVPAAPASGASCDRCESAVPADAAASTTTDINGKFTLSYVPSGKDIPVIISVGKWRRVVTLPRVPECATTPLDATQTRLPRNQTEGNIPKIALSTGALDALECILRKNKLGLDDSEFTNASGTGRVNLYAGVTGTDQYNADNIPFTQSNPWWDTTAN
jgi:hypothetical protein